MHSQNIKSLIKKAKAAVSVAAGLILFSCQPKQIRPPETIPPPNILEHTFGSLELQKAGGVSTVYKDIRLALDFSPGPNEPLDYLLLSQSSPIPSLAGVRSTQKIIAPADALSRLKAQNFSFVKDIPDGRMIQLTKEGSFLFVRAAETKSTAGATIKSYLLEFDNGRNVLFIGAGAHPDDLRPFLYSLRDEGKEIHVAVLPSESIQDTADLIGLFQPQEAVAPSSFSASDRTALQAKLKDQFFQGMLIYANPGETISF